MRKLFEIKYMVVVIFVLVVFLGRSVLAVNLEVSVEKESLVVGEIFSAFVLMDTEGQSINTLEGDLMYDERLVEPEALNFGSSFVNLWIEKPDIKTPGIIHFSGITPGGISTRENEVFKVIFRAKEEGEANLFLDNVSLFLNDGQGSLISALLKNVNVKIVENKEGSIHSVVIEDTVSPEAFRIFRTRDESAYDNKYFIAFSTVDKDSGVDYYKVCEFFSCVMGESPFLLKNQTPFYYIKVKAYDINGNIREASVISPWLTLLLLVVIISVIYFSRRYLHLYKV